MSRRPSFEPRRRARRRALQAIYQWQMTGQDPSGILVQFREAQDMSAVDEPYFETLLSGVARHHDELDQALESHLDRPIGQVDLMERAILRIGVFELLHCPEVPGRVVLKESIELADRFGAEQGHAYINAVLDRAAAALRPLETRSDKPAAE